MMKKQLVLPCFLVVVLIAAALQSTAGGGGEPSPRPLVANLTSSPETRDFIHSRCEMVQRPECASGCYLLLLPYAASINGSAIRAARTAVTAMVSELGAYAADLRKVAGTARTEFDPSACLQTAQEGTDGCKEPLAKLARLEVEVEADGGKKKVVTEQDVADVKRWLDSVIAKSKQCRLFEPDGVGQVGVDLPRQGIVSSSLEASSALVNGMYAAQAQQPAAAANNNNATNPWAAPAQAASSPAARDFIHSLCSATCPSSPLDARACFNLLAPYAVFINGSSIRAVRSGVTVVAAELQALAKSVVEFNKTSGEDYELGPCMQVIQEAANGGKQQLDDLSRLDGKATDQDLANVNKWYQDVNAKIKKCDYDISDVPGSLHVINTFTALYGLVGSAGKPKLNQPPV